MVGSEGRGGEWWAVREGEGGEWWTVKEEGGGRGDGVVRREGGGWSGGGVCSLSCPPFVSSLSCRCRPVLTLCCRRASLSHLAVAYNKQ